MTRGVHEQPVDLVVLDQPVFSSQHEAVLAVVDLVVGDPVVSHRGVVARLAVGTRLANGPGDPDHHVVNVIVQDLAMAAVQLNGRCGPVRP